MNVDGVTRDQSSKWRGGIRDFLTLGMVVLIVIGVMRSWPLITEALTHIAALNRRTLLVLGGAWLSLMVVRGVVHRATHPALRLTHGILLDQVNLAASNSLPGGSIIGIAARFRIARSLGLSAEASGLTVAASGQAFALGRWVLALTVALSFVLAGRGTNADVVVCVAALGAFGVAALLWRVVTGTGPVTQAVLAIIGSVHRWAALRWVWARRFHLDRSLDRVQRGVGKIVCERGPTLLMAGVLSSMVSASIVVVLTSEFGRDASPATWDVLRAYLLARVATSFVPTPGNVGALDGALIAGLVATGLDPSVAIAVVLLYRAVTFVAPIGVGTVAWLLWRRHSTRTEAPSERCDGNGGALEEKAQSDGQHHPAPSVPMAPGVGLEPTTL